MIVNTNCVCNASNSVCTVLIDECAVGQAAADVTDGTGHLTAICGVRIKSDTMSCCVTSAGKTPIGFPVSSQYFLLQ